MWGWLIFIGVIGTLGQLVVTEALKLADMTVLMPLDFLKLVWAAFLGIIFFAEMPDAPHLGRRRDRIRQLILHRLARGQAAPGREDGGVGTSRAIRLQVNE